MNLFDLVNTIRSKHYLFEVIIPGKESFGKQNADQIDALHGNLENYFSTIARRYGQTTLTITLYAKNGSSFIRKDTVIVDIPAVVEKSTTVNPRQTNLSFSGTERNNTPIQHTTVPMVTKADIDVVQLKTENRFLSERVDELKSRNRELERKNEEYHNENLRLSRENATEKDRRELEYKQKEIELISKQKQGLSGIMEDVKTWPAEAWQFVAGLLPNHPMSKSLNQNSTTEQPQLNGAVKHSDPDAQACIEVIDSLLLKQSPEITGMVAMLIEHLITNPNILKAVYEKFFPAQTTENKDQVTPNT